MTEGILALPTHREWRMYKTRNLDTKDHFLHHHKNNSTAQSASSNMAFKNRICYIGWHLIDQISDTAYNFYLLS